MATKFGVYIGRFQPFHNGHYRALSKMLDKAERVIIVLGSDKIAANVKNPWSTAQRTEMIRSALSEEQNARVEITSVRDHHYNEHLWQSEVDQRVRSLTGNAGYGDVTLFGFIKDESSYYLKTFPQWQIEMVSTGLDTNATDVRDALFGNDPSANWMKMVPPGVAAWICKWGWKGVFENSYQELEENHPVNPELRQMREAHNYILGYKAMWEAPSKVPFPVIFTTVDAVVIKAGHILLVERGRNPGKGLLALPGGFLNPHEELLDGALRELKEETKIVASKKVLAESVRSSHVFAHPDRSLRGRTITHAYLIDLGINGPLPAVKGSDDAAQAMWVPLHRVYELQETFFEDHFHIIEYFTRK